jgi:hypothetical protein
MNDEIIKHLDDESLFRQCQTDEQTAKICLSESIWTLRANSPLAPLFMVRDQYKNWLDFYTNVRKDYLYGVYTHNVPGGMFANIKVAFHRLLQSINHQYAKKIKTMKQLESAAINADFVTDNSSYGFIVLVRKRVVYDQETMRKNTLYSIGEGTDNFPEPTILMFPDLMDVPVMNLRVGSCTWRKKQVIKYICVDFSQQALIESRLIKYIRDAFYLAFNNRNNTMIFIRSLGWKVGETMMIVEDADKNYIAILPKNSEYEGHVYEFRQMAGEQSVAMPGGIDNLRWYISTFGTFHKLEDLATFLPKGFPILE